ncbi:ATP-dependent (S)-NAD(P)H-hydrate dehydratase [Leucoagaricus sp. SymC.cos]|nr:ATP-dependent (S)-NAD(P)H-hydrate dehydratase [Leucoagaricus sp. SymC.cos]
MPIPRHILEQMKALIPPLNGTLHKGQSGRVGVLGGALDYTGAPYFAAISALRFGADLSHVICSPTAAGPIKSYSPDLIVHPILREDAPADSVKRELESLLARLHVLVVGPGLGREDYMQSYARTAVSIARSRGMFIVLDADGLYMIGKDRSIIQGYRRSVITPNVVEFKRLSEQFGVSPDTPSDRKAQMLSRVLGGVTVLEKGAQDIIVTDTEGEEADLAASHLQGANPGKEKFCELVEVDIPGGLKRCGGQGDVLSGCVGTFLAWGRCYEDGAFGDKSIPASRVPLLGAIGGSMVTRTASRFAFKKAGRSTITEDLLPEIGYAFADVFGHDKQFGGKL